MPGLIFLSFKYLSSFGLSFFNIPQLYCSKSHDHCSISAHLVIRLNSSKPYPYRVSSIGMGVEPIRTRVFSVS